MQMIAPFHILRDNLQQRPFLHLKSFSLMSSCKHSWLLSVRPSQSFDSWLLWWAKLVCQWTRVSLEILSCMAMLTTILTYLRVIGHQELYTAGSLPLVLLSMSWTFNIYLFSQMSSAVFEVSKCYRNAFGKALSNV